MKIKDMIKKRNIDVLIMTLILIIGAVIFILVNDSDELWNFANSYKMFNGYKIYQDLNVIVTPLFFYIAQIFFKIFGGNLLAFRIYNIVISTSFIMLIYYIFTCLKIPRRRAIFYIAIITYMFSSMIAAGANYNMLALIPILISIMEIIKKKENSISLGLLLFITFMIKQNIFIYFALGIFVYKIMSRDSIRNKLLSLFKIYIVSAIGIVIFLIYLYLDNNLYHFINYCFLGLVEFGSNNVAFEFSGGQYVYISVIAVITTIFVINNKKISKLLDKEIIDNVKILLSFGVPLLLISYPIANYYHATLASTIIIIEFIYIIESILIENLEVRRIVEKKIYFIFVLTLIICFYYGLIIAISGIKNEQFVFNTQGAYYGTIMKKEDFDKIEAICNYIKEQEKYKIDVKVLSYKADLYMVNLNKNNGIFDLAFIGNLGKNGEEGLINEIKKLKNTLILFESDSDNIFWQESKLARDYIIDNYKKIGEIEEYSIYYIK